MSTLIDCVLPFAVHKTIHISMPNSLVKVNVKLLQPSQSLPLGLFTVIFFLIAIQTINPLEESLAGQFEQRYPVMYGEKLIGEVR